MAKKRKSYMAMNNVFNTFERVIKTQAGVLYVKGKPGIGKSARFAKMAKENGWHLEDVRLAQMDETDIIGVPFKKDVEITNEKGEKVTQTVSFFAPPEWLVRSCSRPTLILFDELNRAQIGVRNSALQLLNERQVGGFKLNDNVFMVAVGNLGDKGGDNNEGDGCEVEEFDAALNNRLIHFEYDMRLPEWVENYANEYVNEHIINFLKINPGLYYQPPTGENSDSDAYPTPRSWTFLSNLIGKDTQPHEFLGMLQQVGHSYVGTSSLKFIRYCENLQQISIKDIINKYDKIRKDVEALNRDRKSELLFQLQKVDIISLCKDDAKTKKSEATPKDQLNNIAAFLNIIDADERVAFLNDHLDAIDIEDISGHKNFKMFLKQFKNIFEKIDAFTK